MKDIRGWLTPHEGQFLENASRLMKSKTGAIVEIGSYLGKSTVRLSQSGQKVYAIDPHKGILSGGKARATLSRFRKNIQEAGVERVVVAIVKTSKDAAFGWRMPIKFLFIDGLHDEAHAMEDYLLWSPHVTVGGTLAMHDAFCGWPGAGDAAMRCIIYGTEYQEIGVIGSIVYGVKGKPSLLQHMNIIRNQLLIELCQGIYRARWIPHIVSFVLVHRFLRIFLINRFTLVR